MNRQANSGWADGGVFAVSGDAALDEDGFVMNAMDFCQAFLTRDKRYVLGRNVYAQSVASVVEVDGFIDDFTTDTLYMKKPVIRSGDVPKDALVLAASGGKPLTVKRHLDEMGLRNLDYFAFYRFSGLPLHPVVFNENFDTVWEENPSRFEWAFNLLADETSRETWRNLMNFRKHLDIRYLEGFSSREHQQYYEDFLQLRESGETFVDVGGYDGFTSLEFIRRCPGYDSIHIFEPDIANNRKCHDALGGHPGVFIYERGLSNTHGLLKFHSDGSASKASDTGSVSIEVDRLDTLLQSPPTFIKMDIEGAELAALEGASNLIRQHHPRLAISVYHHPADFWRVPEKIFSLRNGYAVYLRHYTECIYETIMFFIPDNR